MMIQFQGADSLHSLNLSNEGKSNTKKPLEKSDPMFTMGVEIHWCNETKSKWFGHVTTVNVQRKRAREHRSNLEHSGGGHNPVRKDQCTSLNRWHHEEGKKIMWMY